MLTRRCPRADQLEALASGRRISARIQQHVAGCPTCSDIVAVLREQAELLDELRRAVADDLDHGTREEILETCRKAVDARREPRRGSGRET